MVSAWSDRDALIELCDSRELVHKDEATIITIIRHSDFEPYPSVQRPGPPSIISSCNYGQIGVNYSGAICQHMNTLALRYVPRVGDEGTSISTGTSEGDCTPSKRGPGRPRTRVTPISISIAGCGEVHAMQGRQRIVCGDGRDMWGYVPWTCKRVDCPDDLEINAHRRAIAAMGYVRAYQTLLARDGQELPVLAHIVCSPPQARAIDDLATDEGLKALRRELSKLLDRLGVAGGISILHTHRMDRLDHQDVVDDDAAEGVEGVRARMLAMIARGRRIHWRAGPHWHVLAMIPGHLADSFREACAAAYSATHWVTKVVALGLDADHAANVIDYATTHAAVIRRSDGQGRARHVTVAFGCLKDLCVVGTDRTPVPQVCPSCGGPLTEALPWLASQQGGPPPRPWVRKRVSRDYVLSETKKVAVSWIAHEAAAIAAALDPVAHWGHLIYRQGSDPPPTDMRGSEPWRPPGVRLSDLIADRLARDRAVGLRDIYVARVVLADPGASPRCCASCVGPPSEDIYTISTMCSIGDVTPEEIDYETIRRPDI